MPMLSTRGAAAVSESTAILRGLAPDGGLYVPQTFPHFSLDEIAALSALDYQARALTILQKFLPDFTADELKNAIAGALARALTTRRSPRSARSAHGRMRWNSGTGRRSRLRTWRSSFCRTC